MPIDTRIRAVAARRPHPDRGCECLERDGMTLLLLEALLALLILIAIVWWTMFAGRHKGELKPPADHDPPTSSTRETDDTGKP